MIEKNLFGILPDGREVSRYLLKNKAGCRIGIIDYGAIVTDISVPDQNGIFADVVLGYDSLNDYIHDAYFMGAVVGRFGNRIANGRFRLNGREYNLPVNDGANHLHGGPKGLYKVLWESESYESGNRLCVKLTYNSPDGEEGYPGNVIMSVVYTLTGANELEIHYKGTTDTPTILNPTHHSYFNLSGDPAKLILDHELQIYADKYTPVDRFQIPTGELADVTGTPLDFRVALAIGTNIDDDFEQLKYGNGYDHNWVLNQYDTTVRKAAFVYEPSSARILEVLTDQPGIQFYSGNFLNRSVIGKNNATYDKRSGLCLEAQHFPDAPNQPHFPPVKVTPEKAYHQTTIYRFSVR